MIPCQTTAAARLSNSLTQSLLSVMTDLEIVMVNKSLDAARDFMARNNVSSITSVNMVVEQFIRQRF